MNNESQKKLKINSIFGLFYWIVVTAFMLLAAVLFLSKFSTPVNLRVYNVGSGSMEPTIKTGSLVFVSSRPTYSKGDIITFTGERLSQTFTHRIVGTTNRDDLTAFITKGDANGANDPTPVIQNKIVGKVLFNVPYIGYLVNFVQSQVGFTLLIVIPLTLIIYHEFNNFKTEAKSYVSRKKNSITSLKIIGFIFIFIVYTTPHTLALLSDSEKPAFIQSATSLDSELTSSSSQFGPSDPMALDKSDSVERVFKIENVGNMPFEHSFHVANLSGALCEKIDLRFYTLNEFGDKDLLLLSTSLDDYENGTVSPLNFGLLNPSEIIEVLVEAGLNSTTGPAHSGAECSFNFESRSWDSSYAYREAFYDTETIDNNFKAAQISNPVVCELGEVFTIGDIETDGATPPHDEFNYPGYGLAVPPVPYFANPFVYGTNLVSEWPWNSNYVKNYADRFDLEFDYEGSSGAKGKLILGWAPGNSGTEYKQVWVGTTNIGHFTHTANRSLPYGGLYADETQELELNNGTNTITLKHLSGDGSYWDFVTLEVTDCANAIPLSSAREGN